MNKEKEVGKKYPLLIKEDRGLFVFFSYASYLWDRIYMLCFKKEYCRIILMHGP